MVWRLPFFFSARCNDDGPGPTTAVMAVDEPLPRSSLHQSYTWVILTRVKTAVSIPDRLFEAADRAAEKLGLSRSRLYALALEEFLERMRTRDVTKQLDQVYASEDSSLDPVLAELQAISLERDEW